MTNFLKMIRFMHFFIFFVLLNSTVNSTVNTDMKFVGTDPIYIQIANYIKKLIQKGAFAKGDAIPSVRDFGAANGVNPNTVARAYEILVNDRVIVSLPKKGYFVPTDVDDDEQSIDTRSTILEKKIKTLMNEGYTKEEIVEILKNL